MKAMISRSLRFCPRGEMASSDANDTGAGVEEWLPTVTANTTPRAAVRLPVERGPNRRRVQRWLRITGEKLDQRRQLCAPSDAAERDRRPPAAARTNRDGRSAEHAVHARSAVFDVADVLQRDLGHL